MSKRNIWIIVLSLATATSYMVLGFEITVLGLLTALVVMI